jgi:hypothetical protein
MALIAQVDDSTYLLLGAMALVIFIMLARVQRYYRRPRAKQPTWPSPRRETSEEPSPRMEGPGAMVKWEVEMHETARTLSAQLNSKMGALEQLIRDADRAAARLEAALTAAGDGVATPAAGGANDERLSETVDNPPQLPPASQAEGLRSAATVDAPAASHPPAERRYEEIYTLADYGLPASEIAQRVGSPVGEIELILSLRGKR